MQDRHSAVGVFDSGLGGLTAIKELKKILPHEDFIYFGDTGRVPYGTRSFETIKQYAADDMRFLMTFDIKLAIVACGTVSSVALGELKESFSLPIVDALSPACKKAVAVTKSGEIAILATPATIRHKGFEKEIKGIDPALSAHPVACPMFVPLIENGYISDENQVTRMIATEYVSKLAGTGTDTVILGCTHYPIIKGIISDVAADILGREVTVIDSGYEAAVAAKELLCEHDLLNSDKTDGSVRYFVSDEAQNFEKTATVFLGEKPDNITKISI